MQTQRWYVTVFEFEHNHSMLPDKYSSMLAPHRKISTADTIQIENFRKVGIRPPDMYGSFANNAGGYEKIGFILKDKYNQTRQQMAEMLSDATGAIKFLKGRRLEDPLMYVKYTVDDQKRLQHLLWCDGDSRMNYRVFGDVLAFDATYRKNKYMCPFVVFSGVNNHNQTIVFASALVANETEDTYVWLLE